MANPKGLAFLLVERYAGHATISWAVSNGICTMGSRPEAKLLSRTHSGSINCIVGILIGACVRARPYSWAFYCFAGLFRKFDPTYFALLHVSIQLRKGDEGC